MLVIISSPTAAMSPLQQNILVMQRNVKAIESTMHVISATSVLSNHASWKELRGIIERTHSLIEQLNSDLELRMRVNNIIGAPAALHRLNIHISRYTKSFSKKIGSAATSVPDYAAWKGGLFELTTAAELINICQDNPLYTENFYPLVMGLNIKMTPMVDITTVDLTTAPPILKYTAWQMNKQARRQQMPTCATQELDIITEGLVIECKSKNKNKAIGSFYTKRTLCNAGPDNGTVTLSNQSLFDGKKALLIYPKDKKHSSMGVYHHDQGATKKECSFSFFCAKITLEKHLYFKHPSVKIETIDLDQDKSHRRFEGDTI